NIIDSLKQVKGVGDVVLLTPFDYSMQVWLNSDRLTSYGLTPSDIANALKRQNIQAAVGRIGAQPALPDQQFQLNIQTKGRLSTVEEFGAVVVRANPDGSFVRVRDVARVELAAKKSDSIGRLDGQPAAVIATYQAPGGNAIDSADQTRKILEDLKASFPEGVDYKITYDTTLFVKQSMEEVVHTLIDAIVVVEAVEAHLEKDHTISPAEAARRAMGEITAPIIAITLVLLSVFIPCAFIPGISGQLFRQFAVAVSVSMVISAINALTLS